MFSHVMLGCNDINSSKAFYDAVLGALGIAAGTIDAQGRCFYMTPAGIFAITQPIDGKPAGHGNGSTIGFRASSAEQVDAWHAAGLANGGVSCEDAPGTRESGVGPLYLAYLRDPAGNKICALYR
ncbi:VOC family protein [Shewanella sp. NIFS-20-20]|uniref:VOC family protein n=1 Tax=Shewanella sp. NIFS-20-20 TaxID=2853806 RepID=UPI001C437DD4|nr:VOC family protein [Shewanella sp. NIFS-20-20]MBV7315781.1 VOC family protein [Shewanella sp. NIFS-20-20]